MLTPQQAFKTGFLLRCAEVGLSADAAEHLAGLAMEKRALSAADAIGWPLGAAAIGGVGLGAMGGHLLAKATEGHQIDPKEFKKQELIDMYRLQTELLRRRAMTRARLQAASAAAKPVWG